MKKYLLSKRSLVFSFFIVLLNISNWAYAQGASTYSWTGTVDTNFYNPSNWTSSVGLVQFDNNGFKVVRTSTSSKSPVISSFVNWQPGIFDNTNGNLTVNADFNFFYNDFLNGAVTINAAGKFTGRNQIRVGRDGVGVVNVNGGTFQISSAENWRAILIGVNANGNGTVAINNGGVLLCDNLEIGTRDGYPLGVLAINSGVATANVGTPIGPDGIVNVNGGTLNAGTFLIVGDNFGTPGTTNKTPDYGNLNINSGTVIFNQSIAVNPYFSIRTGAKVLIDNGSLVLNRDNYDYTAEINAYVASGQIVAAGGKTIKVDYNAAAKTTTVTAVYYYYVDGDGDGYGTTTKIASSSTTIPVGYAANSSDCNDADAAQHGTVYFIDIDGDGFDNGKISLCTGAAVPLGYTLVSSGVDCNDSESFGQTPITYYIDADRDGYGSAKTAILSSANAPSGYSTNNKDSNDADASINLGLESNQWNPEIKLYPNPVQEGWFIISSSDNIDDVEIEIYNLLGQKIDFAISKAESNTIKIVISQSVKSGLYWVKISQNEQTITKQIVLN